VRRDERPDLDFALAGRAGVADPLSLALGRQDGLDALQAVAQTDFADHDAAGVAGLPLARFLLVCRHFSHS
jgi:hypothetical protein